MKKIKKRYYILLAIFLIIFFAFFFASTFIKNYIVKHSNELVGRKITLSELHINYFKVSVQLKDFVLYEANKTDTFVSFNEFYIDFDPTKIFSKELGFSEIRLVNPKLTFTQNDTIYNFTDIINFFNKPSTEPKKPEKPVDTLKSVTKYSIANFVLRDGRVRYKDLKLNSKFNLSNLNLNLPYIAWDSKNANMEIDFKIDKGTIGIKSQIDPVAKNYKVKIKTKDISLAPFEPYLKDYMKIKSFDGLLQSNIAINGSYANVYNVVVSGQVGVSKFAMTDENGKPFVKTDFANVVLDSIDIGKSYYKISKIEIDKPDLYAELNKKGTNIQSIFAPVLSTDTTKPKPVSKPDTTAVASNKMVYIIESFVIKNGKVEFVDNTLTRKFTYNLVNMNVDVKDIREKTEKMPVKFSVGLNKLGTLTGNTILSMVQSKNITADMEVKNLDLISFSPYSEFYVARPITEGHLDYKLKLKMTPKTLENLNNIFVGKLDFGKKTNDATAMKVPVLLGLYLLKDSKGNIAIDLPVTGNPDDPKFSYWKLVWQTLGNLLVKTASEPFKAMGSLFGGIDPEKMKSLDFSLAQDSLTTEQTDKLDKIAELRTKKPQLTYLFTQVTGVEKEKAIIAVNNVKRNFIIAKSGTMDEKLLNTTVSKVDGKDTAFIAYMVSKLPEAKTLPVNDACMKIIGQEKTNALFNTLLTKRNSLISSYLTGKGFKPEDFKVVTGDLLNLSEEQKNPKYLIEINIR